MIKLLKIDENGMFIEDVIVKEIPTVTHEDEEGNLTLIPDPQFIQTPCEGGFYKPKWNGTEWVEGLSQAEIDAIKNTPQPKTDVEKLQEIVDMLLMDSLGV